MEIEHLVIKKECLPNPNKINGHERLDLFRQVLDSFELERIPIQIDFHEMMIETALPYIFLDEWAADYEQILKLFSSPTHNAKSFTFCPKLFGKTVALAMFCAAYIYVIPNANLAMISPFMRASDKMKSLIRKFMRELPYFKDASVVVENPESITIELYGNIRTINWYTDIITVCYYSLIRLLCHVVCVLCVGMLFKSIIVASYNKKK